MTNHICKPWCTMSCSCRRWEGTPSLCFLEEEEGELPAGSPGESHPATQPSPLSGQVAASVRAQSLESVRGPEHNVPLTPGVPQHRDGHQGFQREGWPSPEPPPPPPLTLDSRGAAPLCPLHCLGCCPRPTGLDPSRRKALPATAAACCRPPSSLPASDAHTAGGPGAHLLPAAQLRTPWEAAPPTAAPRLLSAFLPFPPSGAHGWLSLRP